MSTTPLFPDLEGDGPMERPPVDLGPAPPPRLRRPDREQMLMRPCSLDELLADDHDARLVWQLVQTWDLSRFLDTIRAHAPEPPAGATQVEPSTRLRPELELRLAELESKVQAIQGGRGAES